MPLAIAVCVTLFNLVGPMLFTAWIGSTVPVRMLIAGLSLAPLGLVLGIPFAFGLRAAHERDPWLTAWAWGINGCMSVLGSIVSVVLLDELWLRRRDVDCSRDLHHRFRGPAARAGKVNDARPSRSNLLRYWAGVALAIALGLALRAPALHGSLLGDDWDHYAMVHGQYPVQRSALDLYNFAANTVAERRALCSRGRLPWWTDPGFHLAFLRPLSSALLLFDHTVLGSAAPARHHWHSALWWAASLIASAGLLGRVLPRSVAFIAVLLYAADDAHTLPFAWNARLRSRW